MITNTNYRFLYSHYKAGNLDGIDIPTKENKNKIYKLGKSLKYNKILDKIIQLIDRIFSALPKFFHLEWTKRHLQRKAQQVLRNFSKKSIAKLSDEVKTRSTHLLDTYKQTTRFALLPYDSFKGVAAGRPLANSLLNDPFIDIFKTKLMSSLDWKSSQNFFDTQLPLVPLGNKNAALLYLEMVKEGKFKLQMGSLMAALRLGEDKVESLDLSQLAKVIVDDDIKIMCELCPNLKSLNLKNCDKLTDQAFRILSNLKQLNSLKASGSLFSFKRKTNKKIQYLSKLSQLKELEIYGCNAILNDTFKHLAKLKNLTMLGIQGNYCIPARVMIDLVNKLNKLTDLRICADDEFLTELKSPERFRKLNIKHSHINRYDIFPLERFKNLIELNLESCHVKEENLKNLSKLTKLKKLNLSFIKTSSFMEVEDTHMAFLSKLTNLEELKLRFNTILSSDTLKHLSTLKKLKKLDLNGCRNILDKGEGGLHNPGLIDLSKITFLTELNIRGCLSPRTFFNPLSTLSNLINLTKIQGIIQVSIGQEQALAEFKKLEVLELEEVKDFEWLASFPRLHTLELRSDDWDSVTDEEFKHLSQLASLRDLKILNFWNCSNEKIETFNQLSLNNLEISLNVENVTKEDVQNLSRLNMHTTINIPQRYDEIEELLKNLPPRFEITGAVYDFDRGSV